MLQGWVTQDHFFLVDGEPFQRATISFTLSLDSFDWTRMLGSELHLAGMKDCCNLAN